VVDEAPDVAHRSEFEAFVTDRGPGIRRTLVGRYGVDVGVEAYADTVEYAWAHWASIRGMENPSGYLFRVGQSRSRRHRTKRAPAALPSEDQRREVSDQPELHDALWKLPPRQRTAVVLVHGFDYSYRDAAELMAVSEDALRNYVHRGMTRLRIILGSREALDESC
jgi:RNA polymerase sigma-70 factor (ECF subfamily)